MAVGAVVSTSETRMDLWIYENWVAEGHKARLHIADCAFCNYGRGIHPGAGAKNGRWLGPFPTLVAALRAAHATEGTVSRCKKCTP